MRMVKYIFSIVLIIVVLLSIILVFSAEYFSYKKKEEFSYERANKIKTISLCVMGGSALLLIILYLI